MISRHQKHGATAVVCERDPHSQTATITLNQPATGNAITSTMAQLLIQMLRKAENDPLVRVVIITGSGKYFCTGMDLSSALTSTTDMLSGQDKKLNGSNSNIFLALRRCTKPTIAVLNGPALGGGVGLMLATDIRLCWSSVPGDFYICFPEVRRGLVPAFISLVVVPELGLAKARQYMLTGERVVAEQCLHDGTISKVCTSQNDLMQTVNTYTQMLVLGGPRALTNVKRLACIAVGSPWLAPSFSILDSNENQSISPQELAQRVFNETLTSDEAVYGIQSFLNQKVSNTNVNHQQSSVTFKISTQANKEVDWRNYITTKQFSKL